MLHFITLIYYTCYTITLSVKQLINHKTTLIPKNLEYISDFEVWGLILVAYKKTNVHDVPQGSGSILFNIYISDMFYDIDKCHIASCAEYNKLYTGNFNIEEVIQKLELP